MDMDQVASWLLSNYLVNDARNRRLVTCILMQDDWQFIDARAEQARVQRWGEDDDFGADPGGVDDATAFALTGLVECHDGPHTDVCPYAREG